MKEVWSVRMRASQRKEGRGAKGKGLSSTSDIHISGAEGLYSKSEIKGIVEQYIDRAVMHPRGIPDNIIITCEQLSEPPLTVRALPLVTARCSNTDEAGALIRHMLGAVGISKRALSAAFRILNNNEPIRGACLIKAATGRRMDADKGRGIRASRIGITKAAARRLGFGLDKRGINTETVREALILASKVASCGGIQAELCISDDPDYTTGYIASRYLGYIRIPNIKMKHDRRGGRIFFIRKDASIPEVINYLEKRPVMIDRISECNGEVKADEIPLIRHQFCGKRHLNSFSGEVFITPQVICAGASQVASTENE